MLEAWDLNPSKVKRLSKPSTPVLGPKQTPVGMGSSFPSKRAEVRNEWHYTSTPLYAVMARTRTTLPFFYIYLVI